MIAASLFERHVDIILALQSALSLARGYPGSILAGVY
jgi:hypothetical protein